MAKHYHFIGIGGIGMGALASLVLAKGGKVTGSDLKENLMVCRLREKGAKIFIGHSAENVAGADCVIFSSAVSRDNPELLAAVEKKLPILRRAELLSELMQDHVGVTVAGAHGKTTTTSMVGALLAKAGLSPTVAVGGIRNSECSNADLGEGRYFVAEADESDGTFLCYNPTYSIITNIDYEHIDYFLTWENILAAYQKFILKTKPDGLVIVCGDDPHLRNFADKGGRTFVTYGFSEGNTITAKNIEQRFEKDWFSAFDCWVRGKNVGRIILSVPGEHNILNAMACVALGLELGIEFSIIQKSLIGFQGVNRRFQRIGQKNGVKVFDDYGHHPTEIRATLKTARDLHPERLITVFQPHRYTRTKYLMEEFVKCLTLTAEDAPGMPGVPARGVVIGHVPRAGGAPANFPQINQRKFARCNGPLNDLRERCPQGRPVTDVLIVTDIYPASEQPIEGITSQKLVEKIKQTGFQEAVYLDKDAMIEYLLRVTRQGDLVLTLGAGDIYQIGPKFLQAMPSEENEPAVLGFAGKDNPRDLGHIGVVMGGCSSERDISLKSGNGVFKALQQAGCHVSALDLTTTSETEILALLESMRFDVAFLALHGKFGEDGFIQSIMEKAGLIYTGSDAQSSRIAMNKILTQEKLQAQGIEIPSHKIVSQGEPMDWEDVVRSLGGLPVVVKPAAEGSSIGITMVYDPASAAQALEQAFGYGPQILIERYIKGREITCGILGERALPLVEIKTKRAFFDYSAKYEPGMTEYIVPAPLELNKTREIQQTALKVFGILGCRDFARVDFIVDEAGRAFVLEMNTIPGFTPTSLLPKAAGHAGYTFPELCRYIVQLALKRRNAQLNTKVPLWQGREEHLTEIN